MDEYKRCQPCNSTVDCIRSYKSELSVMLQIDMMQARGLFVDLMKKTNERMSQEVKKSIMQQNTVLLFEFESPGFMPNRTFAIHVAEYDWASGNVAEKCIKLLAIHVQTPNVQVELRDLQHFFQPGLLKTEHVVPVIIPRTQLWQDVDIIQLIQKASKPSTHRIEIQDPRTGNSVCTILHTPHLQKYIRMNTLVSIGMDSKTDFQLINTDQRNPLIQFGRYEILKNIMQAAIRCLQDANVHKDFTFVDMTEFTIMRFPIFGSIGCLCTFSVMCTQDKNTCEINASGYFDMPYISVNHQKNTMTGSKAPKTSVKHTPPANHTPPTQKKTANHTPSTPKKTANNTPSTPKKTANHTPPTSKKTANHTPPPKPAPKQVQSKVGKHHAENGNHHADTGKHHADTGKHHADTGNHHADTGKHHADTGKHHADTGNHHADIGKHHVENGQHHVDGESHHADTSQDAAIAGTTPRIGMLPVIPTLPHILTLPTLPTLPVIMPHIMLPTLPVIVPHIMLPTLPTLPVLPQLTPIIILPTLPTLPVLPQLSPIIILPAVLPVVQILSAPVNNIVGWSSVGFHSNGVEPPALVADHHSPAVPINTHRMPPTSATMLHRHESMRLLMNAGIDPFMSTVAHLSMLYERHGPTVTVL